MAGQLRELIKQAPISQIVGAFIPLQRRGQNLMALCPFHGDTNPSMTVNDGRGTFRCWSCQTGGDSITFVMEFKKIDFVEAMRECAKILGLPDDELNREKKKNPKLELAFRVLNYANKIYVKVASTQPMHFQKFVEERQLSAESISRFQVSYAPGNNLLTQQLLTLTGDMGEAARAMAREIDLVRISDKSGRPYDFYRDRIVFPIHDHAGQVRGFSCRKVLPEQEPKFLNSRDSFVFHKAAKCRP
jgi:DNA primase